MIMASWPAVRFALPFSALSQYSMRAFGGARNVRSCPVSEGSPLRCVPRGAKAVRVCFVSDRGHRHHRVDENGEGL
jgi:hypothetical protein